MVERVEQETDPEVLLHIARQRVEPAFSRLKGIPSVLPGSEDSESPSNTLDQKDFLLRVDAAPTPGTDPDCGGLSQNALP